MSPGALVRVRILRESRCPNCGEWVEVREQSEKAACPWCSNVWSLTAQPKRVLQGVLNGR